MKRSDYFLNTFALIAGGFWLYWLGFCIYKAAR